MQVPQRYTHNNQKIDHGILNTLIPQWLPSCGSGGTLVCYFFSQKEDLTLSLVMAQFESLIKREEIIYIMRNTDLILYGIYD